LLSVNHYIPSTLLLFVLKEEELLDLELQEPSVNLQSVAQNTSPPQSPILMDLSGSSPSLNDEPQDDALKTPPQTTTIKKRGRPKSKETIEKDAANLSRVQASEAAMNDKSLADEPNHSRNSRGIKAADLAKEMIDQKKTKLALLEKKTEAENALRERQLSLEEGRLQFEKDRLKFEADEAERRHELELEDRKEKSKMFDLLFKSIAKK
jgi:hypothetical protein